MGLIYLDACLLIYMAENDAVWGRRAVNVLAGATGAEFCISPLVKMECLVGPIKQADRELEGTFTHLFDSFVQLEMPEEIYLHAAQLRARFGLKTADALHLACAQHHGCEALWTNDDRLSHASRGLAKMVLR